MAAPSPWLHHDGCPLPRMDPVGPLIRWCRRPHKVVNVSMCPLLFTVFARVKKKKKVKDDTMKLAVKRRKRGSQNKQLVLGFWMGSVKRNRGQ